MSTTDVDCFELVALEVADLNGYCYGSQDFSPVVWRRLPSLRFSMLVGRRIICPQTLIAAKSSHCQTGAGDSECRNWLRASSYIMRAHVNDQCNPGPNHRYVRPSGRCPVDR